MSKVWVVGILVWGVTGVSFAQGQFSIGAGYNGWNTNYAPPAQDNGYEVVIPVALSVSLNPDLDVYGQGEFMRAGDTYTSNGSNGTYDLSNVSDTILGGDLNFKSFSLDSILSVAVNVPTGDTTWEIKEQSSIVPTEFIGSRYSGRGFGCSAFYGLSFPDGKGQYSAGVGYLYSGAFNPSYGSVVTATSLNLGNAVFLALNHSTPYQNDEHEIIRFSVYQSFPTYVDGQPFYQLGTNFNGSYNWSNPKALSFELGGQVYLPSAWANGGGLVTESDNSNGPRIYADAIYAFGDFSLTGLVKYIFQNDYSTTDIYYDGGGWLGGIEPAYRFRLTDGSSLSVSAGFDYVDANNYALDANQNRTSLIFGMWNLMTSYQVKL